MGSLIVIGRVHTVLGQTQGPWSPQGKGPTLHQSPSVSPPLGPPSLPPPLPSLPSSPHCVKHILAQCPEVCLTQFGPAILPRSRLDSTWGRIQIKQILHSIEVLFIGLYYVDT